jgi:hypothetical protein
MRNLRPLVFSLSALAALAISSNSMACDGEKPKDDSKKPSMLCDGEKPKDDSKKPSMLCDGEEKPKDDSKKPSFSMI